MERTYKTVEELREGFVIKAAKYITYLQRLIEECDLYYSVADVERCNFYRAKLEAVRDILVIFGLKDEVYKKVNMEGKI